MSETNAQRYETLLETVERPARYAGGEMNAVHKPWDEVTLHAAILFPDTYEIGMSHLGIKILYDILNARPDTLCERAFAPWVDMAAQLREAALPLLSLESRTALASFDLLGFTLQYELCYTTVLEMLDLAGLPLRTRDRDDRHPLIIAGGPCAINPEPLSAFMDAFVIGDGEEVTDEIADLLVQAKSQGIKRPELLARLSLIPGVYVPSCPQTTVRRRIVQDLDAAPYPERMIVPFTEIIHDRIVLEVMRGCTRGCRFCQAGFIYRPVRSRSVARLTKLAEMLIESTGYEELSLSSLSTGDYPDLVKLIESLSGCAKARQVDISLPSLRADGPLKAVLASLAGQRHGGLTFAPEAGTQRLRDALNKGVTDQDIEDTAREAFQSGTSSVKLYCMLGLPTETDEDILGMADVAKRVSAVYFTLPKGERPKGLRISVSASSFVPKPFTPFQWAAQDTMEELARKQRLLRAALQHIKGAVFQWHDPDTSFLEAVFARGDKTLCDVIETAWRSGCRLDGWSEHFQLDRWFQAFAIHGIDPHAYANRERVVGEALPWAFIDAGITEAYLAREWERTHTATITPDCRNGCQGCGLEGVCLCD